MNRKTAVRVAAVPVEVFPIKTVLTASALALALLIVLSAGHL